MIKYSYLKEAVDDEYALIQIEEGEFKDVVFSFGKVKFTEAEDGEHLNIAYNYTVVKDTPSNPFPDINESKDLRVITTEILSDILDSYE